MTLYGLTCGYWTHDPDNLDEHVIAHHRAGQDDQLYDLFDDQYDGRAMYQCEDRIRA
jgi:hypothetical protein